MPISSDGLRVTGIGTFINQHFCAVPANQRAYMWEKEHVEDYWNDIIHAMDTAQDAEYFIGSIVLSRKEGSEVLEVVDGQQRLATTMMIYAALRDYFQQHGHNDHAETCERYLSQVDEETIENLPKLVLNEDDDGFFREHVITRTPTGARSNPTKSRQSKKKRFKDSHVNIATAAESIRTKLNSLVHDLPVEHAVAKLKKLQKYLRNSVKLISVIVENDESAYTIFETLNDRGLDLSKADLLKNHLFRTAGNRLDTVKGSWSEMVGAIATTSKEDTEVDPKRCTARRGQ